MVFGVPMSNQQKSPLIRYRYDALDRLSSHRQLDNSDCQRFYCVSHLVTEVQGDEHISIVQHGDQLLAQHQRQDAQDKSGLIATDLQRSVLNMLQAQCPRAIAYCPYGHRVFESGLSSLLGFNGHRSEPVTGHYLLGNGYRAFNSVLMRFNSPDSLSPFGKGGFNTYAYCQGDPINRSDPTGHFFSWISNLFSRLKTSYKSNIYGYPVKPTRNITRISEGIFSFEDTYQHKARITFQGHTFGSGKGVMLDSQRAVGPSGLLKLAEEQGVNVKSYSNVRLVICYSGGRVGVYSSDADSTFGAIFSKLVKRPVKAFKGTVTGDDLSKQFGWLKEGETSTRGEYFGLHKTDHPYDPIIYGLQIRSA
jgi:RHS repeat-associated protein